MEPSFVWRASHFSTPVCPPIKITQNAGNRSSSGARCTRMRAVRFAGRPDRFGMLTGFARRPFDQRSLSLEPPARRGFNIEVRFRILSQSLNDQRADLSRNRPHDALGQPNSLVRDDDTISVLAPAQTFDR